MKLGGRFCWQCIINIILVAPPIAAWAIYRRYKNNETFQRALLHFKVPLERIIELDGLLEQVQDQDQAQTGEEEKSRS